MNNIKVEFYVGSKPPLVSEPNDRQELVTATNKFTIYLFVVNHPFAGWWVLGGLSIFFYLTDLPPSLTGSSQGYPYP